MSNSLAVAMVTAALRRILAEALAGVPAGGVENVRVSSLRPDMLTGADADAAGVNVFLYQVAANASWGGQALPTRRPDGSVVARPEQALDLHYLLTFSGDENALEPQRLLGVAVTTLVAQPVLSRERVRDVVARRWSTIRRPGSGTSTWPTRSTWCASARTAQHRRSLEAVDEFVQVSVPAVGHLSGVGRAARRRCVPAACAAGAHPRHRRRRVEPSRGDPGGGGREPAGPDDAGSRIAPRGSSPRDLVTRRRIDGVESRRSALSAGLLSVALPGGSAAGPQTAQVLQPVSLGARPPASRHWRPVGGRLHAEPADRAVAAGSGFAIGPGRRRRRRRRRPSSRAVTPAVGRSQRVVLQC